MLLSPVNQIKQKPKQYFGTSLSLQQSRIGFFSSSSGESVGDILSNLRFTNTLSLILSVDFLYIFDTKVTLLDSEILENIKT